MFYRFARAAIGIIFRILYRFSVSGRENVPDGAALICVNHSSLADPVLVAMALKAKDRPRFMAKQELFNKFGLKQLITALGAYPVERGASDMGAIRTTLESDEKRRRDAGLPVGRAAGAGLSVGGTEGFYQ
jgi:1-acyl-sn-glycerol-3-phosphate acyltransferase